MPLSPTFEIRLELVVHTRRINLAESDPDAARVLDLDLGLTVEGVGNLYYKWHGVRPLLLRYLFGVEKLGVFGWAGKLLAHHTIGETLRKGRFHITQMSVLYQSLLVLGLVAMTACESDLEKIQRLDQERGTACLTAEIDQRVYMEERHPGGISKENSMKRATPAAESLGREWSESQAKCELLTRKYNAIGR